MCLAIPGQILEIVDEARRIAVVDVAGVRRRINVSLLDGDGSGSGAQSGDWVLIHVGFALSKIDEQEARAAMEFLESIGQAYDDEIRALAESNIG